VLPFFWGNGILPFVVPDVHAGDVLLLDKDVICVGDCICSNVYETTQSTKIVRKENKSFPCIDKNYFHVVKIYYQIVKIYYRDVKIYFQSMKIILSHTKKRLPHDKSSVYRVANAFCLSVE